MNLLTLDLDSPDFLKLLEAKEQRVSARTIDTIELLCHRNKRGELIEKSTYLKVASFIINTINRRPPGSMQLNELIDLARINFDPSLKAGVSWYLLKVKEDLESRGMIKRTIVPKTRVQHIMLKKKYHQCVVFINTLSKFE